MRKNFYSLAAIVANGMKRDAIGGQAYILFDKRGRSYDVAAF